MQDEPVKCVRVLITQIYADGSSTLTDVREPDKVTYEATRLSEIEYSIFELEPAAKAELMLRILVPAREAAIMQIVSPVPK